MTKMIPKNNKNLEPQKYIDILITIQHQIEESQVQAFQAINVVLNMRNWIIGKMVTEKQQEYAWGCNFIEKLAKDLQNMYPENQGFSARNMYRMVAFYQYYQNIAAAASELKVVKNQSGHL